MTPPDALLGHLTLRVRGAPPILRERPIVGAQMMSRLAEGRRAVLLPDLLGAVFTLCASAQRSSSRRAVLAALGHPLAGDAARRDARAVALDTAREHLQRLALGLGLGAPAGADAHWIRDAPVMALPTQVSLADDAVRARAAASLGPWLERRLLGQPVQDWLAAWRAAPTEALARWCERTDHPIARWLDALRPRAAAVELDCRPLELLAGGEPALRALAQDLEHDPRFAEAPLWQGAPAETGPWTRVGRPVPVRTLWERIGARIADLLHLARGDELACGSLALGGGAGIAWTEMARGLLVHMVRLEPGPMDAETARAAVYRVLAPTEWNFHPAGAFARGLEAGQFDADAARLAAAVLDPCLAFDVADEGSRGA